MHEEDAGFVGRTNVVRSFETEYGDDFDAGFADFNVPSLIWDVPLARQEVGVFSVALKASDNLLRQRMTSDDRSQEHDNGSHALSLRANPRWGATTLREQLFKKRLCLSPYACQRRDATQNVGKLG